MSEVKKTAEMIAKEALASIKAAKEPKDIKAEDPKKAETHGPAAGSSPEKVESSKVQEPKTDNPPVAVKPEQKQEEAEPEKDAPNEDQEPEQKPETDQKPEEKKRDKFQERIDELVGEIKALRAEKDADKTAVKRLQEELNNLKSAQAKPAQEADINQKLNETERKRIEAYMAEDAKKPREERREMSREDLEEWLIEDMTSANEWMVERNLRRRDERVNDRNRIEADVESTNIRAAQKESERRMFEKHPDLNFSVQVGKLMAEGKSEAEAKAQVSNNPKLKVIAQILSDPENQKKYLLAPNGPELLAQEMEKLMSSKPTKPEDTSDRDKRIAEEAAEAERQRQSRVDAGVGSTTGGKSPESKDPKYDKMLSIAKRAGISKEDLDKSLARRKSIGAI